jgi:hypothetical protein
MTAMTAFLHTLRVRHQSRSILEIDGEEEPTQQGRGNAVIAVIAVIAPLFPALTNDGILTA